VGILVIVIFFNLYNKVCEARCGVTSLPLLSKLFIQTTTPLNLVELQFATSMTLLFSYFLLNVVCQLFLLKFADRCSITYIMR
jgi:hypothetical protein